MGGTLPHLLIIYQSIGCPILVDMGKIATQVGSNWPNPAEVRQLADVIAVG